MLFCYLLFCYKQHFQCFCYVLPNNKIINIILLIMYSIVFAKEVDDKFSSKMSTGTVNCKPIQECCKQYQYNSPKTVNLNQEKSEMLKITK